MQRVIRCFTTVLPLVCLMMSVNLNADDAFDYLNREYDKTYNQAIRSAPEVASAYALRGNAWCEKGEYDKAIADYNQAIRLDPNGAAAYALRGIAWCWKGGYDKAIADYNQAIRLDPNGATAYWRRGSAWCWKGEYDKAIADYNQTIRLDPNYAHCYNSLALLQATCPDARYRDGVKALENANRSYQLDGRNCFYCHNTLAAAYAESGDFDRAVTWQEKAIQFAPSEEIKQECRARLELYRQRCPYRMLPKLR